MNDHTPQFLLTGAQRMAELGQAPIPAAPYYRADYFEAEREAIFRRTWLQIGHVCELAEPGAFIVRPIEVLGASVLITRGKDGTFRAFHNVCTHRGTQLVAESEGRQANFTCRYHAWTFGGDGELRAAPDFERFYVDKAACALKAIAVDVCAGFIFVNLDRAPHQPLREFLGPIAAMLETLPAAKATTFSEYVYEIDANWKLTYDNFQENYHLRFVHPRSSGGGTGPDNPFGYPNAFGFHGPHRTQTIWSDGSVQLTPVQQVAFGNAYRFTQADGFGEAPYSREYFAIFPNMFLLGNPSMHFSHVVMPISPTRSRGVIRLYWIGDDDSAAKRFAREYAMASARDVHSEDRAVIEAGQAGLSSGALDHIHLQAQEVLVRHFFHQVDDRVQAYNAQQREAGVQP